MNIKPNLGIYITSLTVGFIISFIAFVIYSGGEATQAIFTFIWSLIYFALVLIVAVLCGYPVFKFLMTRLSVHSFLRVLIAGLISIVPTLTIYSIIMSYWVVDGISIEYVVSHFLKLLPASLCVGIIGVIVYWMQEQSYNQKLQKDANNASELGVKCKNMFKSLFKKKNIIVIETKTGVISDSEGNVLMNPSDFLSNLPQSQNGSYPAIKVFELESEDGVKLSGAVWNIQGRMAVQLLAHHDKFGKDWNDWSEEGELSRLKWLENCLSKAGAPIGNHKFGSSSANFDRKGGFSSAWLSYNT